MESRRKKRNEVRGERAVEKPLRAKVQNQDFCTSLGNPQNPRISTFPTAPAAAAIYLLSARLENKNQNPDLGPRLTYRKQKMVLTMGSTLERVCCCRCPFIRMRHSGILPFRCSYYYFLPMHRFGRLTSRARGRNRIRTRPFPRPEPTIQIQFAHGGSTNMSAVTEFSSARGEGVAVVKTNE